MMEAREGGLELTYEGDQPPSETALALAEAIMGLHAGDVSLRVESGTVTLGLRLETRAALVVAA
jgi:hypothetical protein